MAKFISKALVDYSGLGKTIGDVQRSFSLLEFLDFCTVVEGIALYDELVPVGGRYRHVWESEFNLLDESGVLSKAEVESSPAHIGLEPKRVNIERRIGPKVTRSTVVDAWYETGRLIGAERATGISALPLLRQRTQYEEHAVVKEEHTFCNLVMQYKDLSFALQDLRKKSRINLEPYCVIPIPPLPLIVLQRSQRKEDLLPRALEVRQEFSSLRDALTELRATLDDPEVPLREKLKFRESWEKTWGTLGKYKGSSFTFDLADAAKDKINIERSLDGVGLDTLRLTKLIEIAIAQASEFLRRKRVRILHKAAEGYMLSSDGEMNRHIKRLFGHEVTEAEFAELHKLGFL